MTVMREAEEGWKGVWKGNGSCDEVLRQRIGTWFRTFLLGQLEGEAGVAVPRLALAGVGGGSREGGKMAKKEEESRCSPQYLDEDLGWPHYPKA